MAKCIKNIITQTVSKTNDKEAQKKVASHKYIYCPKSEFKQLRRNK